MLLLYLERVQVVQGQYCYCTHVLRPDSLDLSVISLGPQTPGCRWGAGGKVLFLSLPLRLGSGYLLDTILVAASLKHWSRREMIRPTFCHFSCEKEMDQISWIEFNFNLWQSMMMPELWPFQDLNMTSVRSSHFSPARNAWPSCSRFGCKGDDFCWIDQNVSNREPTEGLFFSYYGPWCSEARLLVKLLLTFDAHLIVMQTFMREERFDSLVHLESQIILALIKSDWGQSLWQVGTWKKTRAAPSSGWTGMPLCDLVSESKTQAKGK